MQSSVRPYTSCQFSNKMSSSQLKCRRDVIYDMKVRIRGLRVVCGRCRAFLRAIGLMALHSGRDLWRCRTDE